jgi:hypothetical protein
MNETDRKNQLKKKLKDKLNSQKLLRSNKEQKEKVVDMNLKKVGIEDSKKFKNMMKNMNINNLTDEIKKELQNNGIDINQFLNFEKK